jgi:hypothetical protein
MNDEELRGKLVAVPVIDWTFCCYGCANYDHKSKKFDVIGFCSELHKLELNNKKCCKLNTKTPSTNNIYIENTDEAYKKYCTDKLKWILENTD